MFHRNSPPHRLLASWHSRIIPARLAGRRCEANGVLSAVIMKKLSERLDVESVTVTFLPLPKGRKRGNAIGFCATAPIATLEAAGGAPPWRWVNGKPEVLTYETVKR